MMPMDIPYTELSPAALRAIVEEFITREGTEYGQIEYALEDNVRQVVRQLEQGEVVVNYDPVTESCSLRQVSQN